MTGLVEELEEFESEHGLAALLDHLGLDGLANHVVALYAVAETAWTCWREVMPNGNDRLQMAAHDALRDAHTRLTETERSLFDRGRAIRCGK